MEYIDGMVEMFQQLEDGKVSESDFMTALNKTDFTMGEVYDYWVSEYN